VYKVENMVHHIDKKKMVHHKNYGG